MQNETYEKMLDLKSILIRSWGNFISHAGWLPIPAFTIAVIVFVFVDSHKIYRVHPILSSINVAIFMGGSILGAVLAGRGYIAGGARTLLFLGCGLLLFGMASISGSALFSFGHLDGGIFARDFGAFFSGLFHLAGAVSISMCLTGAADQKRQWLHVLGLYFLCILLMSVISGLAILHMLPELISESTSTHGRTVILSLTIGEYIVSAILFGIRDYQKKMIFFRWYWMGLALIGIGIASVALEDLQGAPLSWVGYVSQSAGQLYILGCLIAISYRVQIDRLPAGWGTGQSFRLIENELHDSQERFRAAFENGGIPMVLTSIDNNKLLKVNKAYCKLLGYCELELVGHSFTEFTHPDDVGDNLDALEKISSGEIDVFGMEKRYIRSDGQTIWVNMSTAAVRDAQNRAAYLVTHFVDISQHKQAEDELRKAKEDVEEQVRGRTRQLQNVIDTLQGEVSERILAERALRASQKELRALTSELSLAEERERRRIALLLHDHIGQLLAVSKMKLRAAQKSSPEEMAKSVEEIRLLIEEAIKITRSLTLEISPPSLYTLGLDAALSEKCEKFAAENGITCIFEHNGKLEDVADDLRAVLFRSASELLLNSLKHSNATSIKVSIGRQDHHVELRVQDNGCGFDASTLESRDKLDRGFGLMSIRERISHLGGLMSIESCKNKGTTIGILTPLQCALPPNL